MPITYDRIASHYEKAIAPLERWFLERLRKEAIATLPVGGRILEVGAGTGLNFVLYDPEAHGVAIEPSTEMLRIATRKPKPNSLSLVQSNAEQLPFADASFDGALGTLVMCSVQSPEQVFAELRRVVRAGGKVSLLEHVRPNGFLGLVFDLLNLVTVPLINDHVNRRTAETARRVGLDVTNVRKVGWGIINLFTCVV
jgi:ubiquinone/menaquinone biosynthesis C-methylase UbiE